MAVVDELVTILGIEVDKKATSEAKGFSKVIGGTKDTVLKLGSALLVAQGAITAYTVSLAASVDEQGKFSESTGVAFETLQALQFASQISGGSISDMNSDLENLTKTMSSPIPGEYNETLLMLGINTRKANGEMKTADQLLLDLSDRFEGLNAQKSAQLGDKLGLTDSTVRLLRLGRDGISELTDEAKSLGGVLGTDAAKDAAEFNDSLLRVRFSLKGIADTTSSSLFPAMSDALDIFTDWIGENKEFISLGLEQVINGVSKGFNLFLDVGNELLSMISELLPDFDEFNEGLDATNVIAITVAGALAILAANALIIAAPFIAAGVAIAGVVLVLEDLYAAFTGGDSVIGDFVSQFTEKFPKITKVLKDVATYIQDIFLGVIDSIVDSFSPVLDFVSKIGSLIGDTVVGGLESLEASLDGIDVNASANALPSPSVSPSTISSAQTNNSSSNVTMNINGAGNPALVGNEVVNRMGLASSPSLQGIAPVSQ